MPTSYFPISWGTIKLWAARVSTDNGRRTTIHELTAGDRHPVDDRGLKPRIARYELQFDDVPGEAEEPLDRFLRLKVQVDEGARLIHTHPIDGSYLARVGEFTYDLDGEYQFPINVQIEFVADDVIEPVTPAGAGANGIIGESSVEAAADNLAGKLSDAELVWRTPDDEPYTDVAKARASAWQDDDSSTRQVVIDSADIANAVDEMIVDLGLEVDLAKFDAYRAAILFVDAFRASAIAATSETPAVFVIRIERECALLPLCARTYGGIEAEDRARQIAELNDVASPGWLAPGQYVFPVPSRNSVRVR